MDARTSVRDQERQGSGRSPLLEGPGLGKGGEEVERDEEASKNAGPSVCLALC